MKEYNNDSRNVKLVESNLNAEFVRKRLDTITTELAFLEHQIEKYKQGNKMPNINAHVSLVYYGNQETVMKCFRTQIHCSTVSNTTSLMGPDVIS